MGEGVGRSKFYFTRRIERMGVFFISLFGEGGVVGIEFHITRQFERIVEGYSVG
jgi:hypothetical protein